MDNENLKSILDDKENIINILNQAGIIAFVNQSGTYTYVNEQWEKETGISSSQAIGRNTEELISGSCAMLAMRTGRTISGEMFMQSALGTDINSIMKYQPILDKEKNVEGCLITSLFPNLDEAQQFGIKLEQILEEFEYLKTSEVRTGGAKYGINDIIGISDAIKELKNQIYIASDSNAACLIEGETGTGKELVAHAIHACSRRSIFPFIRVNCSAIPENLMESEFFGYEEGSFTGGVKGGRAGKFEKAHLGSMFLDEINAMATSMQPKLLRALQEKEIERVGGVESIPFDVRVISASNSSLRNLVEKGSFRRDLFYRLNIITIEIPPLRERKEDIQPLVESFISKFSKDTFRTEKSVSYDAIEYLTDLEWRGNVRELQNVVERTVASTKKEILEASDFKKYTTSDKKTFSKAFYADDIDEEIKSTEADEIENQNLINDGKTDEKLSLSTQKEKSEINAIKYALKKCNGNKTQTARMLEISRTLLYKKLEKYNIS